MGWRRVGGRGRGVGAGGGQHTHPVTPSRPGSAVDTGGLEDKSKQQVLKALRKQQILVTRKSRRCHVLTAKLLPNG